jgi:hypothetical protein
MEPLAWYRIAAPVVFVAGLAVLCAARNVPRFRSMLLGIGVLSGYAILQDQVSARLCPEYFTVLHNPIPGLTDPTLLGIAWGFLGAWWGGALMGYFAGIAATAGRKPPLGPRELVRPMLVLVLAVGTVTAITGLSVWHYAAVFEVRLDPGLTGAVPAENRRGLFVVACYHLTAYAAGVVGSVVLLGWIWRERTGRAAGQ